MSFLSDVRKTAVNYANGDDGRAYAPGVAGIPSGYMVYGADPREYAPTAYGDYLEKSNAVYSVVTYRADFLSMLPLRLYEQSSGSALTAIPRMKDDELMQKIAAKMGIVTSERHIDNSHRNAIITMAAQRHPTDLRVMQRQLGLEEVTSGPIHDLLQFVNPHWTLNDLIYMTSLSVDIWGQSYWFIERGSGTRGRPREIWWAKPTQVMVVPDEKNYISHYEYESVSTGERIPFMPWETVRIVRRNPNDEWQPLVALAPTRIYADHDQASMLSNINLHKQGLNPGAIMMPTDGKMYTDDQAAQMEEDINIRMGGYDRAHRWAVMTHEVKLEKTAVTPKDSEFIIGMDKDLERVANTYKWPIDLLAGKRTYENIDQALKQAWQTTTITGTWYAASMAEQFVPMFGETGIFPYFDTSHIAVLQESEAVRWEREKDQLDVVITRDEWRLGRGMAEVAGGDKLYRDLRQVAIDKEPAEQPTMTPAEAVVEDEVPEPVPVSSNGST